MPAGSEWPWRAERPRPCQVVGCENDGHAKRWDDINHPIEIEVYLCSDHETFAVL